jgi:N-acylneuraminate cytidylyltransferase/CMP-N,N'-diacetyllegionaminic acid synthase
MRIAAIITARGGSKRLPGKNLLPLGGLPLIAHTIRAALGSRRFDSVHVTTDSDPIAAASLEHGAQVIRRPAELARDDTSSEATLAHALEAIATERGMPEAFCLLQPTSPFRDSRHIDEAIAAFAAGGGASMISVRRAPQHLQKLMRIDNGRLTPYFDPAVYESRAPLGELFLPNGAIYAVMTARFLATMSLYGERMVPYVMDEESSLDIDTPADLREAEFLVAKRA